MNLQESGEMYLETIYILHNKTGAVRSLDIARYMGFSKPSVCRAVGLLKNGDYIVVDKEGYITLTDIGREVAEKMYERHTMLTDFFRPSRSRPRNGNRGCLQDRACDKRKIL